MLNQRQLDNRVKWIRALLSGNYTQGRYALKVRLEHGFGYCCLGVACHVIDPQSDQLNVIVRRSQATLSDLFARDQFGMGSSDQNAATNWNDSNAYDFARIADLVAWATEYNLQFEDADNNVPVGYATDWLRQFDGDDPTV